MRKPKAGPPILRIEGLSTGIDPTARDDFTQEALAQPNAKVPKVQDAQAVRDEINRDRARAQRLMIEVFMPHLVTWKPEPRPQAPPRLAHNQRIIQINGEDHLVTIGKNPKWRRT